MTRHSVTCSLSGDVKAQYVTLWSSEVPVNIKNVALMTFLKGQQQNKTIKLDFDDF